MLHASLLSGLKVFKVLVTPLRPCLHEYGSQRKTEFNIKLNITAKAFLNLRWIQVTVGLVLYQEVCFDNLK